MGNCTSDVQCLAANDTEYPLICPKCDQGIELDYEDRLINEFNHKLILKAETIPDSARQICQDCHKKFQIAIRRKHHCRVCGDIFCDECSSLRIRDMIAINSFTDTSRAQELRCCRACFRDILHVKCEQEICGFEFCLNCKLPWHGETPCIPQMTPGSMRTIPDFSGGVLVYPTNTSEPSDSRSKRKSSDKDSRRRRRSSDSSGVSSRGHRHSSGTEKFGEGGPPPSLQPVESESLVSHDQQDSSPSGSASDAFEIRCTKCRHKFTESWSAHKTNPRDGSMIILDKSKWIADGERTRCGICCKTFNPLRTRHHCRVCGDVFCGACSDLSIQGYDPEEKAAEEEFKAFLQSQPLRNAKVTVVEENDISADLHRVCRDCYAQVMRVECPRCATEFCMYCEHKWLGHNGKFCDDVV